MTTDMKNFKNLRGIWMMWGLVLFAVLVTQCKKDDGPDLKAPQFLLNIDNLSYQNNNELTVKLLDFKVSGYHEK